MAIKPEVEIIFCLCLCDDRKVAIPTVEVHFLSLQKAVELTSLK